MNREQWRSSQWMYKWIITVRLHTVHWQLGQRFLFAPDWVHRACSFSVWAFNSWRQYGLSAVSHWILMLNLSMFAIISILFLWWVIFLVLMKRRFYVGFRRKNIKSQKNDVFCSHKDPQCNFWKCRLYKKICHLLVFYFCVLLTLMSMRKRT